MGGERGLEDHKITGTRSFNCKSLIHNFVMTRYLQENVIATRLFTTSKEEKIKLVY